MDRPVRREAATNSTLDPVCRYCRRVRQGSSPVTITEEDQARALAYRRLVESMARGEFERNGRSRILLLLPDLVASSLPPHRLTQEYFRVMVDTYGLSDFTNNSGLVRENLWFCWLPSGLCREWFERELLAWPDAFNPKDRMHGDPPGSTSFLYNGNINTMRRGL